MDALEVKNTCKLPSDYLKSKTNLIDVWKNKMQVLSLRLRFLVASTSILNVKTKRI